jgi:hypothetical protein
MFTVEEFLLAVRDRINRSPENVYNGNYSYEAGANEDGSEGCVMGQVFVELGVPKEGLDRRCGAADGGGSIHNVYGAMEKTGGVNEFLVEWEERNADWRLALRWALDIQSSQDSHIPWGSALAAADRKWPAVVNLTHLPA